MVQKQVKPLSGLVVENTSNAPLKIILGQGIGLEISPQGKMDLTDMTPAEYVNKVASTHGSPGGIDMARGAWADHLRVEQADIRLYENARLCQNTGVLIYELKPWLLQEEKGEPLRVVCKRVIMEQMISGVMHHRYMRIASDMRHMYLFIQTVTPMELVKFHASRSGQDLIVMETSLYVGFAEEVLNIVRMIREGAGRDAFLGALGKLYNKMIRPGSDGTPGAVKSSDRIYPEEKAAVDGSGESDPDPEAVPESQ